MAARDLTQTTNELVVDLDAPEKPEPAIMDGQGVDAVETDNEVVKKLPKGAVTNVDGSISLPLLYPKSVTVKSAGGVREEKFDTLVFHRLNGADRNAVRAAKDNAEAVLIARSLRKHVAIIQALYNKMDTADITRAGEVLDSFF